jgi:hypothetical protein
MRIFFYINKMERAEKKFSKSKKAPINNQMAPDNFYHSANLRKTAARFDRIFNQVSRETSATIQMPSQPQSPEQPSIIAGEAGVTEANS